MIVKVIFESQGRGKMAEKWFHKNVNSSPNKANINLNKKDRFVTGENISGCWRQIFE